MRQKDILMEGFDNITKLYRFLYGNPDASVKFKNAIQVPMEMTMAEDGCLMLRNLNFPEFEPTIMNPANHIETMLAIIDQQKEMPSEHPGFENRWDEIKTYVGILTTLNHKD